MLLLSLVLVHLSVAVPERPIVKVSSTLEQIVAQPKPTSPIDEWIGKPTAIVLTKEQQARIDSIKSRYGIERQAIADSLRAQSEMTIVIKMRDFNGKYRKLVREVLRPEQQPVFDNNFQAQVFTLPKPPR